MPLCTAKNAVALLLDHMTAAKSATRLDLQPGDQLAVLINNLGGSSKLEELVVGREVIQQLESRGYSVVRVWAGHIMTVGGGHEPIAIRNKNFFLGLF